MSSQNLIKEYEAAKLAALENLIAIMVQTIEKEADPDIQSNLKSFFSYCTLLNTPLVDKCIILARKLEIK